MFITPTDTTWDDLESPPGAQLWYLWLHASRINAEIYAEYAGDTVDNSLLVPEFANATLELSRDSSITISHSPLIGLRSTITLQLSDKEAAMLLTMPASEVDQYCERYHKYFPTA